MAIRDTLRTAAYFTIGAVAIGLEAVADASDMIIAKGERIVETGKDVFRATLASRAASEDEIPAPVIEEDTGDNAPVEAV